MITAKNSSLVSIITINYNQTSITLDLLNSIRLLTYNNIEIIVVDNDSKENPKYIINELYPEVKVIVSNKNLGFAGGNNLGIKEAKGDYLFFVNNDTELLAETIEPLLERFESDATIGIISPKILYYEPSNLIQYAGYSAINPFTARNYGIGSLEEDKGQHDIPGITNYAHGAAMMVKREVIDKVGHMPENFFLYYEELDWCEKIKKAGYKVFYEPGSKIFHKESVSIGKLSALKTYYLTRNRILFMRRNYSFCNFLVFVVFLAFFTIPKNIIIYLKNAQYAHIRAFLKGVAWHIKNKNIA